MNPPSKPFLIDKRQVYEAYLEVRSKEGAGGVDGVTIEQFEKDLKGNLYKVWNRLSSGTYFPPPVRAVTIPKKNGGERILGVSTVGDRVAQTVVKQMIEPDLDQIFLADSYGYRPDKSALDAVGVTRERCWKYDWVLVLLSYVFANSWRLWICYFADSASADRRMAGQNGAFGAIE